MVLEQRYSSAQMAQTKLQIENIRRNYTLQSDTALLRILNVEEVGGTANHSEVGLANPAVCAFTWSI